MRINSITPVRFGYSRKNQEFLEHRAALCYDKDLSHAIIEYSRKLNELEKSVLRIQSKEQKGKDALNPALGDFLADGKSALYRAVAMGLDEYSAKKYLVGEYKYYSDSLCRATNVDCCDWRLDVVESITEWLPSVEGSCDRKKPDVDSIEEGIEDGSIREIEPQKPHDEVTSTESSIDSSLLEEIKVTPASPRGFCDISGMNQLKQDLMQNVIEPLNDPEQAKLDLEDYGKEIPMGILLYGPPGCGKTYIIQALAREVDTKAYIMNVANTGSKYVNQSSINIKKAFDSLEQEAKGKDRPIIVFLDEIDGLGSTRDMSSSNTEHIKDISTLLQCIESAQRNNVMVIGASNKYDIIDSAIRRRLEMKYYVGLPNLEQRLEMLKMNLGKKRKAQTLLGDKSALEQIARMLDKYSYHSINIIADNASKNALERGRSEIEVQDFKKAIAESQEEKINETEYKPKTIKRDIGFSGIA